MLSSVAFNLVASLMRTSSTPLIIRIYPPTPPNVKKLKMKVKNWWKAQLAAFNFVNSFDQQTLSSRPFQCHKNLKSKHLKGRSADPSNKRNATKTRNDKKNLSVPLIIRFFLKELKLIQITKLKSIRYICYLILILPTLYHETKTFNNLKQQ